MNQSEELLLELLRCSLNGGELKLPSEPDWAEVLREASVQSVTALAEKALPDSLPAEERKPWQQALRLQYFKYLRYLAAEEELLGTLSAGGFRPVVLKGSAAAVYYPEPSRRAMGDLDLLCRPGEFRSVHRTLLAAGYRQTVGIDQENGQQVRHSELVKDGFTVEPHRHFSDDSEIVDRYLFEGLEHPVSGEIDGHSFPMLPKLANGILLLEHMKSHLRSGVGLRQMLDWMMYVKTELDDDFWTSEFRAAAEAAGLDTLAKASAKLCQLCLGLSRNIRWCDDVEETYCQLLLESLLASGNFGRKQGGSVETVSVHIRQQGLWARLKEAGEYNWRAYHRHPWLKPLCPVYQAFRYLRQTVSGRNGGSLLKELDQGKKRSEMLKKLRIE